MPTDTAPRLAEVFAHWRQTRTGTRPPERLQQQAVALTWSSMQPQGFVKLSQRV